MGRMFGVLNIVLVGVIAVGMSCQHAPGVTTSNADAGSAMLASETKDYLRACTTSEECVVIPMVPGATGRPCRVAVNRNKVDDFYNDVFKPNEAEFREINAYANCGNRQKAHCVDGLCFVQ